MTLGLLIAVALAGGLASTLLGPRLPRGAAWLGLGAALAVLLIAFAVGPDDSFHVGTVGLAGSPTVRLVGLGWAAAAFLLAVIGRVAGGAATTVGPSLMALGASVLALAADDPSLAFAALAAGGVAVILAPTLGAWLADHEEAPLTAVAVRGAGATVAAGLVGMLGVAWSRSPAGPFGGGANGAIDDAGFHLAIGLTLLAMAAAVVVRSGAIPAHLWAARFVGGVTPLAVPGALGWSSAAFTLAALGWSGATVGQGGVALDDAGRLLVVLVALGSIVLGGLAAILHDDLEHVLGYTVVQSAGIGLLAFTTLGLASSGGAGAAPGLGPAAGLGSLAGASAADWLVAVAATISAMAGWIALLRWIFGTHRVSELRGWARRAPGLAIAAAVILVALVGVPGMAVFEARVALASGALPGPLGPALVLLALSPIVAIGRILVAGFGRVAPEVAAAPRERVGVLVRPVGGWSRGGVSRGGLAWLARIVRATVRENAGLVASLAAILLAVVGLAFSVIGTTSA